MDYLKFFFENKSFYLKAGFSEEIANKLACQDTILHKELNDPRNFHLWAEAEEKQLEENYLHSKLAL